MQTFPQTSEVIFSEKFFALFSFSNSTINCLPRLCFASLRSVISIIISNATQLAGEVIVDDFAVIGGGTLVHQFCHLGSHVMIQGGALINKDIPPFVKAAREPIAYCGVNSIGLRRRGYSSETIQQIQDVYRCLYEGKLNVSEAVEMIETTLPATPERDEIITFVRNSRRGIVRGYRSTDTRTT